MYRVLLALTINVVILARMLLPLGVMTLHLGVVMLLPLGVIRVGGAILLGVMMLLSLRVYGVVLGLLDIVQCVVDDSQLLGEI